jgi:hypothetical protein
MVYETMAMPRLIQLDMNGLKVWFPETVRIRTIPCVSLKRIFQNILNPGSILIIHNFNSTSVKKTDFNRH